MRRSASEIVRNLEMRIARLEKQAGPKGGPVSYSYDGMEINDGEDLLSQLNDLEDGYEYTDAYWASDDELHVKGTFSDSIRVKKKTYLEQMSELLLKNGLVIDTLEDDEIMEDLQYESGVAYIKYGGWFMSNKNHGEYQHFAESADVGSYIAFDGKTWTADIVWTGLEGYYGDDKEEVALRNEASDYFNYINRKPFSYKATGNVSQDVKAIKSMMRRI